jgi:hypothetical protein
MEKIVVSKKSEKKGGKELKGKDSQLIIRINKAEKDRFVNLCDDLDTSAAREIRHFIRRYLKEHE